MRARVSIRNSDGAIEANRVLHRDKYSVLWAFHKGKKHYVHAQWNDDGSFAMYYFGEIKYD